MAEKSENQDLVKSMEDALEALEFDTSAGFEESEEEDAFDKSIGFDLEEVSTEDSAYDRGGELDTYLFMKGLADTSQRNTGRVARAVEGLLKVNMGQARLIKSMTDRLESLEDTISNMGSGSRQKPAMTMNQATAMSKAVPQERDFSEGESSDMFEEVNEESMIGPLKKAIAFDIKKGVEDGSIEQQEALNFHLTAATTPIEYIRKNYTPAVVAIVDQHASKRQGA